MTSSETNSREQGAKSLGDVIDSFGLTRAHYVALAMVVLGGMFEVFEQLDVSSLGPSLEKAFGINASQVSLLSTITLLAIVVGGIASGLVADRFGRRRLLSINLIVYCLGTVLSAVAPTYSTLELTRIVTGLGVGGEIAVGLTFLAEFTPTKARGVFVSFFNTVSAGIGAFLVYGYTLVVLGPFAALIGAGPAAWRWVFGLLGLPAILIVFFRRYLPESPRHLLRQGDIEGTNYVLTCLSSGRLKIRRDEVIAYVDSTTAAISESGKNEGPGRELSSIFRRPLRKRTVALGITAYMAWGSQFSVIVLMPLLLVARGHSIAGSLTLTLIQNVGGLLGACLASYGGFALPRRYVVSLGSIAGAASILAFAFFANGNILILVLGFVFQVFVLMVNTTIWLWAPELFPTRVRGFGTSVVVNIGFLGGAIMPLAAGVLFRVDGTIGAFSLVGVMYIIMAISALFVAESQGVSLEQLHGRREAGVQEAHKGTAFLKGRSGPLS
jgi:MFS family permease